MKYTDSSRAFSLIEVALALGVASFCLLAVFSLLPVGLQTSKAAVEQTAAIGILSSVSGDLRATPRGSTQSAQYQLQVGTTTTLYIADDGTSATTLQPQSRYLLNVSFPTNTTGGRAATFVSLTLSWPAAASIANASGSVTSFLALDRN